MAVLESALEWCRGEIFEAQMTMVAGVLVLVLCAVFWKFAEAEHVRALIFPLCAVGIILCSAGFGIPLNQKRMTEFPAAYEQNSAQFIQSEKERVEAFMPIYKQVLIVAFILVLAALTIFWFSTNLTWRGIGVALMLVAFSATVVDYFSKGRAEFYYKQLELAPHHLNNKT